MRSLLLASFLVAAGCGAGTPSTLPPPARACGGVRVPLASELDGHQLALNGMAVREATLLAIDVYVGALYLERETRDVETFLRSEQRKRLELHFVRDVDRETVVRYLRWGFRNNADDVQAAFRHEIGGTLRAFSDYRAGDVVAFEYRPGDGITMTVNGARRASWPGDVFSEVFFRIFVGPKRSNAPLREGLVGGVCNG